MPAAGAAHEEKAVAKDGSSGTSGAGTGILLLVLVVALLAAGGGLLATTLVGERVSRQEVSRLLTGSLSGHAALQQQRYRQLQLISRVFATDQVLKSYLAEAAAARDAVKVLDLVETYQDLLAFDLAIVLDRDGAVVARSDDPQATGEDLSQTSLVSVALAEDQAFGVWQQGGKLYHAVTMPLARDFDLVGYVLVALAIDDALATQLSRIGGADVVYLAAAATGPARAAGTLGPAATQELIAALRKNGEALPRVIGRGETLDRVALTLAQGPAVAALTPLRDAAEQPVGTAVAVTLPGATTSAFDLIRLAQLGAGLAALVLGAILGTLWARRIQAPLRSLAAVAAELARGNYEVEIPRRLSGDHGRIAGGLAALTADLRERRQLEAVIGEVSRTLPEPAPGEASSRPQSQAVALLGLELRRYANPRAGYDAEETLARFGRDLRRVATAVKARKGRIEAVAGHRILAGFAGDGAALGALASAAEAILLLSQRESVFDEPEPPAAAISLGNAVTGSVSWGERPGNAVLGLPAQQLESLLREAAPGDVFLAKPAAEALLPAFRQAGTMPKAQRGVISPMPLYVLSGELAAKVAGVKAPGDGGALDEERLAISDVTAGVLLAGRFEILAELGAGRLAVAFKVRDRERDLLATLKLLRPEVTADPQRLERLTNHMRLLRSLNHAHAVPVYDFGQVGGLPYLLVGYVRGVTLRYVLQQRPQLPVAAGLLLARQIAAGLAAGHALNVLHLDLRPENVLIEGSGLAQVTDFGLAAALIGTMEPGVTARYQAPELLAGQGADARSDVYALGATLYELLAGRPAVEGTTAAEVLEHHRQAVPEPLATLVEGMPLAVDQVVMRCLARSPEQRFASAEEVLAALVELRA